MRRGGPVLLGALLPLVACGQAETAAVRAPEPQLSPIARTQARAVARDMLLPTYGAETAPQVAACVEGAAPPGVLLALLQASRDEARAQLVAVHATPRARACIAESGVDWKAPA